MGVISPRLLAAASVAAHELVDATGGVDELALTRVEGVRAAGDLELHQRIGLAFEFHGVVRLCCGAAQEHIAIAHVLEHHGAIVVGMNTLFHCLCLMVLPGLCTGGEYYAGLVYQRYFRFLRRKSTAFLRNDQTFSHFSALQPLFSPISAYTLKTFGQIS